MPSLSSNPALAAQPAIAEQPILRRNRLWQLEALRGFAALYVLLHHVVTAYLGLTHKIWAIPFRFGPEAVLVFFILSGFVISYAHPNSPSRPEYFKTYFVKRFRRIYPIFILSLLLAYTALLLNGGTWPDVHLTQLFGNIFMFQNISVQPGWGFRPYADNFPLWSLSYEWWFYMMFFPINRWIPRHLQKYLVLVITFVGMLVNAVFPNSFSWFLVFFLIWWWGVELAHEFRETGDISFSRQKTMFALCLLPLAWYTAVSLHWIANGKHTQWTEYPEFDVRYFLMASVIVLMTLLWRKVSFAGFDSTIGRFRTLGGISFAIYVFHSPIIEHVRLLKGRNLFYVDLLLRIGLIILLAWLAEGRLQKWVNKATEPLLGRNSVSRSSQT